MKLRHGVCAAFSAVAVLLPLALPASGSDVPVGQAGVHLYNQVICGREWAPILMGEGRYFNAMNSQSGNTCISVEQRHLTIALERWTPGPKWQWIGIDSGITWGRYTCLDGASGTSTTSQCLKYPVQEKSDGDPVTSIKLYEHMISGNAGYDIWFDKRNMAPQNYRQDNGAEIMIWDERPGQHMWSQWMLWVQGREYGAENWVMHHNGTSWNFLVYWPLHPETYMPLTHLNLFFKDAIRHRQLSAYWYLTGIDAGGEINNPGSPSAGSWGLDISQYTLTGLPVTGTG